MALKKIGTIWVYRCKVNGRTWSKTTGETDKRKAVAKIPQFEVLAQLHRNQPTKLVKLSRAIVTEVARVEVDVSQTSALRIHHCLKNFLQWLGRDMELSKIDTDLLERYQRERLGVASVSTVNRELYALCTMLRENKYRVEKPKFKPGRKTEQRDFSEEELSAFFKACSEEQKTLFSLLLSTGARPAEVIPSIRSTHVALLKKELDLKACTVTIRSAKLKPNQRAKVRVLKVSKELMDRLQGQASQTRGDHVFQINQSLCKLFDRILERAKIPKKDELGRKLTSHSFRHTYASMMAKRVSYNPHILKEILGHHQLSTTDRYIHAQSTAEVVNVSEFLKPESETEEGVGVKGGGQRETPEVTGAS